MTHVILIGVDDSPGAVAAVRWAERFIAERKPTGERWVGVLLAAWSRPVLDSHAIIEDALSQKMARHVLDDLQQAVGVDSEFTGVARRGSPVDALLAEGKDRNADLIVIGSRGRGPVAQVLLGSVSRSVAARADRPVAIIPDPKKRPLTGPGTPGATVVAFDGSEGAKAALRWALANTVGEISVVCAWTQPTTAIYDPVCLDAEAIRSAAERTLMGGLAEVCGETGDDRVTPMLIHGDVRNVVLELALNALRVVIGARSHRGLKGVLLGSSVTYIASHSSVPVVVVPPSEAAERE